jgi:hypothetical protein
LPIRAIIGAATAFLLSASAGVTDDGEVDFGEYFLTAVFNVCPEVVRTKGSALADGSWLESVGFISVIAGKPVSLARSDDLEVVHNMNGNGCYVRAVKDNLTANKLFVAEWRDLAKRTHKGVDLDRELAQANWIPPAIHVVDSELKIDVLLILGHISSTKEDPEMYALTVTSL